MCEMIRKRATNRLTKKFKEYCNYEGGIGVRIKRKLDKAHDLSRSCIPTWCGDMLFEIEVHNEQHSVDMNNRTCSCRKWDLTGISYHMLFHVYYK